MLMRAYFADRGEADARRKIVIPDTAHGTNPASVTMAGYEVTPVQTDPAATSTSTTCGARSTSTRPG